MKRLVIYMCVTALTVVVLPVHLFAAQNTDSTPNPIRVTGVYSTLYLNKEEGDLLGIEVMITKTEKNYYVVFQSAEGVALPPVVTKAVVDGNTIMFKVNEPGGYSGTFRGRIKQTGIEGGFVNGQRDPFMRKTFLLPRKCSFWTQ